MKYVSIFTGFVIVCSLVSMWYYHDIKDTYHFNMAAKTIALAIGCQIMAKLIANQISSLFKH